MFSSTNILFPTLFFGLLFYSILCGCSPQKFKKFSYTTVKYDTISNSDLIGKTTLLVMGHISCPATIKMLKDIQKADIDTVQYLLFLENTNTQIQAYNSADTLNNIWSQIRLAFKADTLYIPSVAFCTKERVVKKPNGTVLIKNQCNALKFRYRAFNSPTWFVTNHSGKIIAKSTGWYVNVNNPKEKLLCVLKGEIN
jgi:hypothetical protein